MSLFKRNDLQLVGSAFRPVAYVDLVKEAMRERDLGRVVQLALEMAQKIESAERQVDHILDVLRHEQSRHPQPKPDCRNNTVPKLWGPILTVETGGDD